MLSVLLTVLCYLTVFSYQYLASCLFQNSVQEQLDACRKEFGELKLEMNEIRAKQVLEKGRVDQSYYGIAPSVVVQAALDEADANNSLCRMQRGRDFALRDDPSKVISTANYNSICELYVRFGPFSLRDPPQFMQPPFILSEAHKYF